LRRHAADTCGLAEKYNTVLIACGTPAARRWLPQALALPTFRDGLSNEKRLWCGALRWESLHNVMMETVRYLLNYSAELVGW